MPVGNVLVGDTGGNIEHDDTALAVDVVSIAQTTEFLLTSSIPHVKLDCAQVLYYGGLVSELLTRMWDTEAGVGGAYGGESKRVHFDTESRDILLLELASQVALDEGGL